MDDQIVTTPTPCKICGANSFKEGVCCYCLVLSFEELTSCSQCGRLDIRVNPNTGVCTSCAYELN